jgi:adenosylcobyric acid synthase
MKARVLMFQGTGSDVGKSVMVAGLCRLFARRGLAVRPFKPQNMSNNAAVTRDGGEIGRAQALQARACGVAPSVDMNPVLLKPESDTRAQVILRGKVLRSAEAQSYQGLKSTLLPAILESFKRLRTEADGRTTLHCAACAVQLELEGAAAELGLTLKQFASASRVKLFHARSRQSEGELGK